MNIKFVTVFFALGILMGESWYQADVFVCLLLVLVVVDFAWCFGWRWMLFAGVVVLFGIGRFWLVVNEVPVVDRQEFSGCIVAEVDVRNDQVKYIVQSDWGRVLVNGLRYPVYEFGDCVLVRGALEVPGEIEDFNYGQYLSLFGVKYVVYRADVVRLESGAGWRKVVYGFKSKVEARINQVFAEPYSSFMAGLLLGSRKGIPQGLLEDFNRTGLTHIVAISGYNITLVVVLVSGILAFLPKAWRIWGAMGFIWLFVVLVGMGAAVVRAALMGCLGLLALLMGRQYLAEYGLFAASLAMMIWNPLVLVYDLGFQLSVGATLGLIVFGEAIMSRLQCVTEFMAVRESLAMTLAAQIFALPLIVWNFGRLSVISPVANIFVLPFLPLVMLFGVLGLAWEPLGLPAVMALDVVIWLIEFWAKVPFAELTVEAVPWFIFCWYFYFMFDKYVLRDRVWP